MGLLLVIWIVMGAGTALAVSSSAADLSTEELVGQGWEEECRSGDVSVLPGILGVRYMVRLDDELALSWRADRDH